MIGASRVVGIDELIVDALVFVLLTIIERYYYAKKGSLRE